MIFFSRVRENDFFELFTKSAGYVVVASHELRGMLTSDPSTYERRSREIKEIEHKADEVTHDAVKRLHKYFVTNLDRGDIHRLATRLDDIVDFLDAVAQRIVLYQIKRITPEAVHLSDLCVKASEEIKLAVEALPDLKNKQIIHAHCVEINRLENEADAQLRAGLAKLFREERDERELIKLKEVYELLEGVTDRCEDVANVIDGPICEYS